MLNEFITVSSKHMVVYKNAKNLAIKVCHGTKMVSGSNLGAQIQIVIDFFHNFKIFEDFSFVQIYEITSKNLYSGYQIMFHGALLIKCFKLF